MAKKLTSSKAKEILHDKSVHGHPLTDKQRRFFGAIAGGAKPYNAQLGAMLAPITADDVANFFDMLSVPQKAVTKLISGKYQTPSEAMNIKNPVGAFATDMILDPINLLGGTGIASKASGVYKNTYKLNPWSFKPNPEAYYRGVGKEGIDDILESGIIRSKKQHAYPEPYFSKGVIGDRYAKGYFAELTNEPMKGVGSFQTGDLIQTPVNTVSINNPNLKLYQKDWLRGYKEVKPQKKENGGWLDKYTPKAQNGIEGTMGGLTDIGFNYNGAWGGPSMQDGGNLTFLEPTSRKLPMGHAFPYKDPSTELAISIGGEDGEPAYLIPSFKYGKLLADPKAEFRRTGEHLGGPFKTYQEADEWERTVRHPYVEKGQSIPTPLRRWGKDFQMGGSLPGAVGFTYARTAGAAPANGPYAKKTKASAQDGEKVEYKELPEITVVGSKDKQTRDFYNNLIDKFSENDITSVENPFIDARVIGQYLGIMNMGKKYGFPKVKPETNSGIYRNAKGHYNPFTETIYANDPEKWVAEMAHHVQMKDNVVGKGLQWLGNDLVEYIKQPIASIKGEKPPSPYTKEGTVEHEAHSIIQPMLEEKAMQDYKKYRDSELARSREKRFLLENRNLQNGGEMKFYQQGLDWKPKNISKKGSKIKKDDDGYWNPENWGEPVEIGSNEITMQGVYEPLIGISDTGDVQYMEPGEDYTFDGETVTEYPIAEQGVSVNKADEAPLKKLDQLLNFTNYNDMAKAKKGKKLPKAQMGSYIGGESKGFQPFDIRGAFDEVDYSATGKTNAMRAEEARMAKLYNDDNQEQQSSGSGDSMQKIADVAKLAAMFLKRGGKVPKYLNSGPGIPSAVDSAFGLGTPLDMSGATNPNPYAYQNLNPQAAPQMPVTPGQPQQSGKQKSLATTAGGRLIDKAVGLTGPLAGPLGKVINAGRKVNQSIKQAAKERQAGGLANLSLEASSTRPEETQRRYAPIIPGMSGGYGTGTDFLQMQNGGSMIGGNLTEIQNMYNPGDLYSDLGYEPFDESSNIKQYKKGGKLKKAEGGFNIDPNLANQIGQGAQFAGDVVSGFIDMGTEKRMKQTQRTLGQAAFQQGAQSLQGQYGSFMKDGGGLKYLSNDWQPQVITKFGDYDVKDLLAPPKDADMLRAGGEVRDIRSNYMGDDEKLSMMQMGGELQTYWGGDAETISENPYLPDGGETVMFRGQSHEESDGQGRTGIGITFGQNPVEVERGEPAVKLKDGGTGEDSLNVYGNMISPSYVLSELIHPKFENKLKGMKFKNIAKEYSKQEVKDNKTIKKGIDLANSVNGTSKFDTLALSTANAMIKGGDMSLKLSAYDKQMLAHGQSAILDTAEERGLESDALAKGKIKKAKDSDMAKFGAKMETAQKGKEIPKYRTYVGAPDPLVDRWEDIAKSVANRTQPSGPISLPKRDVSVEVNTKMPSLKVPKLEDLVATEPEKKKSLLEKGLDIYGDLYPYIKPGIRNPLDPGQLTGEMYALATNQLEPVQAQTFTPLLEDVTSVSFQDQLNEIQAQTNAAMRMAGNNPAAQAVIASQAAAAKNKVLAEQLRTNQQLGIETKRRNLEALNKAGLLNLEIFDKQYERQAKAKSATKAQAFEALSSIAEKIGKNKAETLSANVMANMYPQYSWGPQGRIYNTGLTEFNIPTVANDMTPTDAKGNNLLPVYGKKGNITGYKVKESKNGSIVKAIKNL